MYGQFLQLDSSDYDPRYYALMGACAYAAVITRTTSVVLILAEMTEQSQGVVGILVAVAVAYSTANIFTMSFFDTVLSMKKMPYMPILFSSDVYRDSAGMDHVLIKLTAGNYLQKNCSIYDMLVLINNYEVINFDEYIPVVESLEDTKLIGIVKVYHCLEYLSMIGDILVKEFSKKKKLSKNLAVFKEKMEFDRILEVKNNLEGSYKQFGKISQEFHGFINNMKKSEAHIHYGKLDTKHLIHQQPPPGMARKTAFGNHLDVTSNYGDDMSQIGKGRGGIGEKNSVFGGKNSVFGGKNSVFGEKNSVFGKKDSVFSKRKINPNKKEKTSLLGQRNVDRKQTPMPDTPMGASRKGGDRSPSIGLDDSSMKGPQSNIFLIKKKQRYRALEVSSQLIPFMVPTTTCNSWYRF
jgi:hypothetical protein